ncbi:unnamed protein product [Brachionus calyciflorus]|uniref:Uncharacterized protein n=1 Tax=Brachionus calyciflorus TaxID=104777 RepID=A0A813LWU2_9BILA|nr:unnamed protein product [Brachionus calyciflorus]
MVISNLVKEAVFYEKYEQLVQIHAEVIIDNEKEHDSVPAFLIVLSIFQLVNLFHCLLKLYLFAHVIKNEKHTFWLGFFVDFITYQIPVILLLTFLSESLLLNITFLSLGILLLTYQLISKRNPKISTCIVDFDLYDDLSLKISKMSVNNFRSSLIVITSVAIFAIDFGIFKPEYSKTLYFGFTLMDIGVGDFILCHSMKLIRNSDDYIEKNKGFFKDLILTIKKSSILLLLGLIRIITVYLTDYQVLAKICEKITKKSSVKCFILSLTIGLIYQYFLMRNELWLYLLNSSLKRESFIDYNKEGLYSIFGYLAIYLGGEAICHHLNDIQKENKQNEYEQVNKVF